ncbi:hypothetical protein VPNG_02789 [Cytospora leucostoma]|uniref:Transcription factor domain-containing protein n=1 Tax=Cytospora leucostoma TaxID=1230097 RepID=A0A423XJ34_9PEZI|nr:hypothetical protein VPNG_02789 [Cytospora leucostoma]
MDGLCAAQSGLPSPPSSTSAKPRAQCSTSKRECIFKTGPRTRRRRSKLHPAATRKTPPPSAPSKTFTIDVPMSAGIEPADSFDALRDAHEGYIDDLVPEHDIREYSSTTVRSPLPQPSITGHAFSPSTTATSSCSVHGSRDVQPHFNLESASSLLSSFRDDMLPHFPVLKLGPDAKVPSLARDRPFVLLAMLAAVSGGRSLQGHSLYDEEFRKVLGLKFVSGGERSLELLLGLLIYCAWYPFHLRPRNKQAIQYIRMSAEIVHDLDLDQAWQNEDLGVARADQGRIEGIRAYLGCYYLCSSFASTWAKAHSVPYQQWTATCCDILESNTGSEPAIADQTLVWLVRLGHISEETFSLAKGQGIITLGDQHTFLMVKGLQTQVQEWQTRMSPKVSMRPVIKMASMFTDIILYGYPLLKFPQYTSRKRGQTPSATYADPSRLLSCAYGLKPWYEYIASLPPSEFANFASTDWTRFIVTVILGLRLSFPIPNECPGWDHAAARRILDLGSFLRNFSGDDGGSSETPAPSSNNRSGTDVLSASRVVLGVVQRKYEKRLAAVERALAAMEPPHPIASESDEGLRK